MLKIDIENTSNPVNQDEPHVEAQENETLAEPEVENSREEESLDAANVPDEKPDKQDNNKYWAKLKKERAEKKELAESFEQERQKNLQLEEMLHQALNNSSTHYKNNVANELEMAEARLQIALENGDAGDVAKATVEISRITHALNDASKITNFPQNPSNDYANQAILAEEYERRLYDWLDSNPELDKNTAEYDQNLTNQVLSFIKKLDRKYELNNKKNLIGSSSYYSMIDEYLDNLREQGNAPPATAARHFGAVSSRKSAEAIPNRKPRQLTEREKKAAAAFGHSDEKYLSYLEQYDKDMRSKNGS